MLDRTPVNAAITRLIGADTTEQALLATVAQLFPNLTPVELSQALQVATATAERRIVPRQGTNDVHDPKCAVPGHRRSICART